MKRFPVIHCLAVCLVCGAAHAEDGIPSEAQMQTADNAAAARLAKIVADWSRRYEELPGGILIWEIRRQSRCPDFGFEIRPEESGGSLSSLFVSEESAASDRDRRTGMSVSRAKRRITIEFDDRQFRLDADAVAAIRFGETNNTRSSNVPSEDPRFNEALAKRFEGPEPIDVRQPYTIVVEVAKSQSREVAEPEGRVTPDRGLKSETSGRETHFWAKAGSEYPRAIVFSIDELADSRSTGAALTSSLPLVSVLLDAVRSAVHPEFFGAASISDKQPVVDGRVCLEVEESFQRRGDSGKRTLWIDPAHGSRVVRCFLSEQKQGIYQYDIEYDADEPTSLPVRMTVIQLTAAGDAYEWIVAERVSAELDGDSSHHVREVEFPSGTWIIDQITREQYFIRPDGTRREITSRDLMARLRYEDLLADRPTTGPGERGLGLWELHGGTILRWITWPRILLTLPAAYVVWSLGTVVLRGKNRHTRDAPPPS